MKTLKFLLILFIFTGINAGINPLPLFAQRVDLNLLASAGFNPNYIISDAEMTDSSSMSLEEIKNFLQRQLGVLGRYEVLTFEGMNKSSAELIWEASQTYQINPRVLLVLLQKEQSLVDNPNPSPYNLDWATGYGRCDACDPNNPTIAKFKGLAKQIDSAAGALRYYLDNTKETWLKRPGLVYNIDSVPVVPINQATANLYNYTPHLEGNFNFWQVWQRWFAAEKILPEGVVARAKDGDQIWLIKNGQRYPFSLVAFHSRYKAKEILSVSADLLENYEVGPKIKYPNFSLLKNPEGEIYLLADDKKRLIEKTAFRYFGFNPEEVIEVRHEDLLAYDGGEPIVKDKKYPLGILMQDKKTKEIYYVADGVKNPILDKALIKANFAGKKLRPVSAAELKKFPVGEPVKFSDGILLKTADSPEVYLISNGERRLIKDEQTFALLGLTWQNVIRTTVEILSLHPEGEPINLNNTLASNF